MTFASRIRGNKVANVKPAPLGHESVTIRAFSLFQGDLRSLAGSFHMTGLVRAFTVCAALVLGLVSAQAADKAFKRDDLADAAVKLEAQVKTESGA